MIGAGIELLILLREGDPSFSADMNICCIGAGYVGGPTMAMIVTCEGTPLRWLISTNLVLQLGILIVCQSMSPAWMRLSKRREVSDCFYRCGRLSRGRHDYFVNTPTKTYGVGAGRAADLKYIEKCARKIAAVSEGDKIVVEKSTYQCARRNPSKLFCIQMRRAQFPDSLQSGISCGGACDRRLGGSDRVLVGGDQTRRSGSH